MSHAAHHEVETVVTDQPAHEADETHHEPATTSPPPTTLTTTNRDSSSLSLYGAAKLVAADCANANVAFVECKQKDANPRTCLEQGAKVTSCVNTILDICAGQCAQPFTTYKSCLDKSLPAAKAFDECRREERALKVCYYRVTRPVDSNSTPSSSSSSNSA